MTFYLFTVIRLKLKVLSPAYNTVINGRPSVYLDNMNTEGPLPGLEHGLEFVRQGRVRNGRPSVYLDKMNTEGPLSGVEHGLVGLGGR